MASVSALLLAEPIIPLQSGFVAEDLSTVKVENSYTPPNAFSRITKKAHLPTVSEPKDKELIIYVVDQFVYHCSDEQLHLNDGPLRYSKFCDVVKGDLLIAWQKISNPFQLSHFPIVVLYGCSYVLFTYAIQLTWHDNDNDNDDNNNDDNHKQRYPAFLYFFMDPTIGHTHTVALYVLLFVLTFFYVLFVGIEELLEDYPLFGTIYGRSIFGLAICCFVCRFRD